MGNPGPVRNQRDLADVLEMVLDKGIVINADIAITVGDTELLGVEIRAAIASFETAAQYGLAFPSGTDMRRVERASGREPIEGDDDGSEGREIDLGIGASEGGERSAGGRRARARKRPSPRVPIVASGESHDEADGDGDGEGGETEEAESDGDADSSGDESVGNEGAE